MFLPTLIFSSPNSRYKIPNWSSFWPCVNNLEGETPLSPLPTILLLEYHKNNQPWNLRGMKQNLLITYSPRIQRSWAALESQLQQMNLPTRNSGAAIFNTSRFFNKDRRAEILPKTHSPNSNGIHAVHSTLHLWAFQSSRSRPSFMPGWGHLDATNEALKTQEVDHLVSIGERLSSVSHVKF